MADSSPNDANGRLICPICGKRYRFRPELVGHKAKCNGCQAKLRVPEQAGEFELLEAPPGEASDKPANEPPAPEPEAPDQTEDDENGEYELNEPGQTASAPSSKGGDEGEDDDGAGAADEGPPVCPSCNAEVKPTAVLCVNCGFDLKEGKQLQTSVEAGDDAAAKRKGKNKAGDDAAAPGPGAGPSDGAGLDTDALAEETEREHFRRETLFPLILLGVGVAGVLFNAAVLFPQAIDANVFGSLFAPGSWFDRFLLYVKAAGAQTVMQIPMLIAAIFLTAAIFSSNYGTLGRGILKLLALVLVVSSVEDALYLTLDIWTGGFGGIGFLVVVAVSVGLFYALAASLFDMDMNEVFVLWFITLIGPMLINMLIRPTLQAWGIPVI